MFNSKNFDKNIQLETVVFIERHYLVSLGDKPFKIELGHFLRFKLHRQNMTPIKWQFQLNSDFH